MASSHSPGSISVGDERTGTRFWIFPQPFFIPGYEQPDRVWLSILPDEISDGPSSQSMYVVDPLFDKEPYEFPYLPPFDGARCAPVPPGPDRHFDYLDPKSRQFLSVHAFACANFVLHVWQSYLGRPVTWFFAKTFARLEIVSTVDWKNAHAGFGFLELGHSQVGKFRYPYALNFDTIAHEVGHLIALSEMGAPGMVDAVDDFFPFSEAFSDLVSLFSLLQFDSVIDRLMRRTAGNLLLYNELNRFAETSPESQIRLATNFRRMSEVTLEVHDRSLPFVGAVFDSLIDLYHMQLVRLGCADVRLLELDLRQLTADELGRFEALTANSFGVRPLIFQQALTQARDAIGQALASSLRTLLPGSFTLADAAEAIARSADLETARHLHKNFVWREIL